ncbi:Hypothetical protein D9617_14g076750 [Elsinoe fawcettii]|nr:Hypothetical protein D9617_14g076750 [Elsinoe fawcettii]
MDLILLQLCYIFTLWAVFSEAVAPAPHELEMQSHEQTTYRTWHSKIALRDIPVLRGRTVTYDEVAYVAWAPYNWLESFDPGLRHGLVPSFSRSRRAAVAAFWDPNSRTFWTSTVPQYGTSPAQGRKDHMIAEHQKAPMWWSVAEPYAGFRGASVFHAEDGAYYDWESSQVPESHYPRGSIVAAFGSNGGRPDYMPYEMAPCSSCRVPDDSKAAVGATKGCEDVARELGVLTLSTAANNARASSKPWLRAFMAERDLFVPLPEEEKQRLRRPLTPPGAQLPLVQPKPPERPQLPKQPDRSFEPPPSNQQHGADVEDQLHEQQNQQRQYATRYNRQSPSQKPGSGTPSASPRSSGNNTPSRRPMRV